MPPRKRTTRRTPAKRNHCRKTKKFTGTALDAMIAGEDIPQEPPKKKESKLKKLAKFGLGLAAAGAAGYVGYKGYQKWKDKQGQLKAEQKEMDKMDAANRGKIFADKLKAYKTDYDKRKAEFDKQQEGKWWKSKFGGPDSNEKILGLSGDAFATANADMKAYEDAQINAEINQELEDFKNDIKFHLNTMQIGCLDNTLEKMGRQIDEKNHFAYIQDFKNIADKIDRAIRQSGSYAIMEANGENIEEYRRAFIELIDSAVFIYNKYV